MAYCNWGNTSELNQKYHDTEWGIPLWDAISKDLKKRGFKYLGTVTVYSHLQASGIINDHGSDCPCYKKIVCKYPTVKKNRDKEKNVGYFGG